MNTNKMNKETSKAPVHGIPQGVGRALSLIDSTTRSVFHQCSTCTRAEVCANTHALCTICSVGHVHTCKRCRPTSTCVTCTVRVQRHPPNPDKLRHRHQEEPEKMASNRNTGVVLVPLPFSTFFSRYIPIAPQSLFLLMSNEYD